MTKCARAATLPGILLTTLLFLLTSACTRDLHLTVDFDRAPGLLRDARVVWKNLDIGKVAKTEVAGSGHVLASIRIKPEFRQAVLTSSVFHLDDQAGVKRVVMVQKDEAAAPVTPDATLRGFASRLEVDGLRFTIVFGATDKLRPDSRVMWSGKEIGRVTAVSSRGTDKIAAEVVIAAEHRKIVLRNASFYLEGEEGVRSGDRIVMRPDPEVSPPVSEGEVLEGCNSEVECMARRALQPVGTVAVRIKDAVNDWIDWARHEVNGAFSKSDADRIRKDLDDIGAEINALLQSDDETVRKRLPPLREQLNRVTSLLKSGEGEVKLAEIEKKLNELEAKLK